MGSGKMHSREHQGHVVANNRWQSYIDSGTIIHTRCYDTHELWDEILRRTIGAAATCNDLTLNWWCHGKICERVACIRITLKIEWWMIIKFELPSRTSCDGIVEVTMPWIPI
jgi:hypothetical protein